MKKVLCIAAAAMALFAGCQKTEVVYQNDGPQEISFFAVNKVATKTPVDGATYPIDYDMQVAAYLAAGGAGETTGGNYFAGTTFSSVAQGTSPETYLWTGKRYWPLTYSKINFLAVAQPKTGYAGAGSVETTFNTTAQSATVTFKDNHITNNKYNQFDLMYAAGFGDHSVTTPYPDVEMVFKHALSWINFTVATNNVDDVTITVNSIKLNGAHYGGTLTLSNTKYSATGTYHTDEAITINNNSWANHTAVVNNVSVPNATGDAEAEPVTCEVATSNRTAFGNGLMVVPKTYSADYPGFTINYTITYGTVSTTYDYTHEFAKSAEFVWEPGKKYTYNITLNLNEIKVAPSVDIWNPVTSSDINL